MAYTDQNGGAYGTAGAAAYQNKVLGVADRARKQKELMDGGMSARQSYGQVYGGQDFSDGPGFVQNTGTSASAMIGGWKPSGLTGGSAADVAAAGKAFDTYLATPGQPQIGAGPTLPSLAIGRGSATYGSAPNVTARENPLTTIGGIPGTTGSISASGGMPALGANLAGGLPAGNGQLTKITGQSTSEGTAGMNGPAQTDGGVGVDGGASIGQIGGVGSANPAGANPLPLPTTTGGTNNQGLGDASVPARAPGIIGPAGPVAPTTPVTAASTGTYQQPQAAPMTGAPSLANPYDLQNPFLTPINGIGYEARLAGKALSTADEQWALASKANRENAAARGLSNAGMSGIQQENQRNIDMGATSARIGAINDSAVTAAEKGGQWDLQRAGGQLNYGQTAFDQYARGAKLPGEVKAQQIDNDTHDANLQLVKQNWAKIQQKIDNGLDLDNADIAFKRKLAENPALAAALGILPAAITAFGKAAGAGLIGGL